jgi:NAD(P)H-nitrite reductase large subunit
MRYLIIGAGPAGVTAAEALAKADPAGAITLLNGEPGAPYARMAIPYLLAGKIQEADTHIRPDLSHYSRLGIRLDHGRARAVDAAAHTVALEDGRTLPYDRLLVATGSTPALQKIPGIDLPGVHTCWTLEDARTILASARPGLRVVQMGAGFVGCIILKGLVSLGVDLTVLVRSGRMVSRMMNPEASSLLRRWCETKGVRVRVNTLPQAITREADGLRVHLGGGETLAADWYLCLVGVNPALGFLAGSGVATGSGILVDETMRTSVPDIYAAGDVAEFLDCLTGQPMVNAIQPNAVDQGRVAALNMAGRHGASRGGFAFNVLDTLGLISYSFGAWQGLPGGEHVETCDPGRFRYLRLEFQEDRLVGANTVGYLEHAGVLRGLIEGKVRLGPWKERLKSHPTQLMEAYLAQAQQTVPN